MGTWYLGHTKDLTCSWSVAVIIWSDKGYSSSSCCTKIKSAVLITSYAFRCLLKVTVVSASAIYIMFFKSVSITQISLGVENCGVSSSSLLIHNNHPTLYIVPCTEIHLGLKAQEKKQLYSIVYACVYVYVYI